MKISTKGVEEFPHCCQLRVVGNLHPQTENCTPASGCIELGIDNDPHHRVATTIRSQEEAIQALKADGWKPVFTFVGATTLHEITFWVKGPIRLLVPEEQIQTHK